MSKTQQETKLAVEIIFTARADDGQELSEVDRMKLAFQLAGEGHDSNVVLQCMDDWKKAMEERRAAQFRPNTSGGMHLRNAGVNVTSCLQYHNASKAAEQIREALAKRTWSRKTITKETENKNGEITRTEESWIVTTRLPHEKHTNEKTAAKEVPYLKGCRDKEAPDFCDWLGLDRVTLALQSKGDATSTGK